MATDTRDAGAVNRRAGSAGVVEGGRAGPADAGGGRASPAGVEGRTGPAWVARPERSSPGMLRFIVWVALTLGRRAARALLPPICLYFLATGPAIRAASREYLGKALARPPRFADLYRHVHTFAATVLDRVFLLNGQYGLFDVTVHGEAIVQAIVDQGGGCFLLGAHLGSFEVVRTLGRETGGIQVAMTMYEENARKVHAVLTAINPRLALQVIALGKVEAMLKVEEALAHGAFVGMLGDRTFADEGTLAADFLGAPARFPLGPFRMAAMLERPVVLMFGLYRGGNRYEIHFEQLAGLDATGRGGRGAAVEQALHNYVSRLEHYCRLAPYNWFNFYDYWDQDRKQA
jgi:predicted LPLAT superfamily acyltransferase